MKGLAAAVLLWAVPRALEASGVSSESMAGSLSGSGVEVATRLKSKAEIEASMTVEHAAEMVLRMNTTRQASHLTALIRDGILHGRSLRGRAALSRLRGQQEPARMRGTGGKAPAGYNDLSPATELLNSMVGEANVKLDTSQITCRRFAQDRVIGMQEAARVAASLSGRAAGARGAVLRAQATIGAMSEKIPRARNELAAHRRTCSSDASAIKFQIGVVTRDLEVLQKVKGLVKCTRGARAAALLQSGADTVEEGAADDADGVGAVEHGVVECRHCAGGQGLLMVTDAEVQPLLSNLKSEIAQELMQEQLRSAVHGEDANGDGDDDSEEDGDTGADDSTALTQQQVQHMTMVMRMSAAGKSNASDAPDVEPLPVPPTPVDCMPTRACRITSGSCNRLKDRFLVVEGGVGDRLDELKGQFTKAEHYCKLTDSSLVGQIASMADQLREAQSELAEATKEQIEAESESAMRGRQHADLKREYANKQARCCAEQNEARAEICALTKIRGELYKMEGHKVFITDCEVSDWAIGECTRPCGGGVRTMSRKITVAPSGGAACPPLEATEQCNIQQCPINCQVGSWSGWSACSSKCGGGVRERSRTVKVQAMHGGNPCGKTEEAEQCNIQSCDKNCVLGRWSEWGTCSKGCGTGHAMRKRRVASLAVGMGRCPSPTHRMRRQFRTCNSLPCAAVLPRGRDYLQCASKLDVVMLVDSSGSSGQYGWDQTKRLAGTLLKTFTANKGADIKVAVLEFGSWQTKWISHLTDSTTERDIRGMKWLRSGTPTDQALTMAEAEFVYGRPDASPVVLVITDGKPSSILRTTRAARRLQNKAKLLWLPIGRRAPVQLINRLAAAPRQDHIVRFFDYKVMSDKKLINKVIGASCPVVK